MCIRRSMRIKKSQRKRIENQIRTLRIELLAKPKERKMRPWPDPAVYRPLPWKVPRAAKTAIPSEQILRLYTPKKDYTHRPPSMCIEPGHYVSQYALKAVATPRVANLAKPKKLHKPPPLPPKTKRQLRREKELRMNLDEAMKRLARPPRTEVKEPQPEEEPQPPAEPQPPPSIVKDKEAAVRKPPVMGPASAKPPVAGPARAGVAKPPVAGPSATGTAKPPVAGPASAKPPVAGPAAAKPPVANLSATGAAKPPVAGAGRTGGKGNVPMQPTTTPVQPTSAAASTIAAPPRGKRTSVLAATAAPDAKGAKQKDQQPASVPKEITKPVRKK